MISVRVTAICGTIGGHSQLRYIFSVRFYLVLFTFRKCPREVNAIIESQNPNSVFVLSDFNAHLSSPFYTELCNFCVGHKWRRDLKYLGSDSGTHTLVTDAHGCRRWLGHCLLTEVSWLTVTDQLAHKL